MGKAQAKPPRSRWPLWVGGALLLLTGFAAGRFWPCDESGPRPVADAADSSIPSPAADAPASDIVPSGDPPTTATTGDPQLDLRLATEMDQWRYDFGFNADVLEEGIRRFRTAMRPLLLFNGGQDAVPEICRKAHEAAGQLQRRRSGTGRESGANSAGGSGNPSFYVFQAIEQETSDWLLSKTLEEVAPSVPKGGWTRSPRETMWAADGNIVNALRQVVWAGRPDLPAGMNNRLTAALMEWVDEFQLSEDDVAKLSRCILNRLLLLQPGPNGEPPNEDQKTQACKAGLHWLNEAREEARGLYRRTGWVNVPRLVRLSSDAAARLAEIENTAEIVPVSAVEVTSGIAPAVQSLAELSTKARSGGLRTNADITQGPGVLTAPFTQGAAKHAQAWWANGIKMPVEVTNSIGMTFSLIPAGEFFMGSTALQLNQVLQFDPTFKKEWEREEEPQHRVRITRPFYLGIHEVTRGQFSDFIRATGYKTDARRDGKGGLGFDPSTGKFKQDPNFAWNSTGFPQLDNHPVVNVSWTDAAAFCEWLSRKEGVVYRLPTEAEWEYACRAGTTGLFCTGDDAESLTIVANIADATAKVQFSNWKTVQSRDGHIFTAPVGSFRPNAFGLFDMHGNVWEWCQDFYAQNYYAKSPDADPQGPVTGSARVFRGGSWYDAAGLCRSAFRYWDVPSYRDYFLGFRVVAVPLP